MPASLRSLYTVRFLEELGEVGSLTARTLRSVFRRRWEKGMLVRQLEEIGVRSIPVVTLTAAFGGLVFGLQTYIGFHRYIGPGSEGYAGPIISLGLSKELIPLLVAIMVAGRVGSAMAAQIGTMKITEQIDALYSLGADPVRYLVAPRAIAAVITWISSSEPLPSTSAAPSGSGRADFVADRALDARGDVGIVRARRAAGAGIVHVVAFQAFAGAGASRASAERACAVSPSPCASVAATDPSTRAAAGEMRSTEDRFWKS